jgi:hypothetical protein
MSGLREPAAGGDDLACLDPQPGLSEADYRGCRWIEGKPTPLRPGMFCCAPTLRPGSSWCARHHRLVWNYRRSPQRKQAQTATERPVSSRPT